MTLRGETNAPPNGRQPTPERDDAAVPPAFCWGVDQHWSQDPSRAGSAKADLLHQHVAV
jgi:hypothetical protein